MPNLSDDEIIAREKNKIRQARIAGLVGGLALVGFLILVWNVRPEWKDKVLPVLPVVIIAAVIAAWYLFWRPAPEAMSSRIMQKRVDEFPDRLSGVDGGSLCRLSCLPLSARSFVACTS